MSRRAISEKTVKPINAQLPVEPTVEQYNRYNMLLPESFSIYNDEGSIIYRGDVEKAANQLRAEVFGVGPVEEVVEQPKVKAAKRYDKKRGFFLFLPMLLALIALAAAVLGVLNIESIKEYITIYNYKEAGITMLDPACGFIESLIDGLDMGVPTVFADTFVVGDELLDTIAYYAMTIASVLYVIFALIMVIVAIAGLAGKKNEEGFYRKAKLGFLSIVMLLCSLIIAVGGVILATGDIGGIVDFIIGNGDFTAGYVLYGIIAIPVVTFICTCCAYRRYKENRK